jgi:hypothetical protein
VNSSFQSWWGRVDGLIRKALLLLFAALIISQALLLNQAIRTFISRIDKLEGKSIADSQLFIKRGEIEITIENYSTLKPLVFYINGKSIDAPNGRSIRLQVKDSDIIEVGGGPLNDTAVLKVTAVSDSITVPEPGKLVYVKDNLVMIDRIRIK